MLPKGNVEYTYPLSKDIFKVTSTILRGYFSKISIIIEFYFGKNSREFEVVK